MKGWLYYVDFIVWPLIALAILLMDGPTVDFGLGILAWTLIEYGLHAWFLHHTPLGRRIHEAHHAHPHSKEDLDFVPRTITSLSFVVAFFWLTGASFLDFFAGTAAGYGWFITLHHALHHWRISRWHPLYRCKMRHVAHHKIDDCNYGVTTSLWDRVFRTEH